MCVIRSVGQHMQVALLVSYSVCRGTRQVGQGAMDRGVYVGHTQSVVSCLAVHRISSRRVAASRLDDGTLPGTLDHARQEQCTPGHTDRQTDSSRIVVAVVRQKLQRHSLGGGFWWLTSQLTDLASTCN